MQRVGDQGDLFLKEHTKGKADFNILQPKFTNLIIAMIQIQSNPLIDAIKGEISDLFFLHHTGSYTIPKLLQPEILNQLNVNRSSGKSENGGVE